jgi:peptide/nickel transport system permease protein
MRSQLRRIPRPVRWLAGALVTLLVASFAIQAALSAAPGDPAASLAGPRATAAQVAAVRHQLRLDEPLLPRYGHWVAAAIHGDFGTSIVSKEQVSTLIESRLATTAFLVAYAAVLIVVFGVGLGLLGGGVKALGSPTAAISAVAVAVPAFVAAQLLVVVFSLDLGWFPTTGAGSGFADRVWHLTLPAVALALGWAAYVAQITRTAIREESGREHVETAIGRGLSPALVFRRHVMRNAALPIATIAGIASAGLVAGAVVVESAFGLSGVGSLLARAVASKDYNVVLAVSVLVVIVFIVATGLIDLAQRLLDPRIRTRAGAR